MAESVTLELPKTLVLCIPGKTFSNNFLMSFVDLLLGAVQNGYQVKIANAYNSNIYFSRNGCLGGELLKGKHQKPFKGMEYDYLLWIDSDQYFNWKSVEKLIQDDKDVVCAAYHMIDGKHSNAVEVWDIEAAKRYGYMKAIEMAELSGKTELIKVDYAGMGLMLMKKGVVEKLTYPWFSEVKVDLGDETEYSTSEDLGFCLKLKSHGVDIFLDPTVIIGHEKTVML